MTSSVEAHRFRISISQSVLDDLHARLDRARWPIAQDAAPEWSLGASVPHMRDLAAYWRGGYDWRAVEAGLNRFAHYRLPLEGRLVHAIIEPGSGASAAPLVLTHGWPGSFIEFVDMIEPLAHPERFGGNADDGFTVVIPSVPGYAFSDPPPAAMGPREVGALWTKLMRDVLGHPTWLAHGSDWGAAITSWMAFDHPQHVRAIHLTMPILSSAPGADDPPFDEEERAYMQAMAARQGPGEIAYQLMNGGRPQTISFSLLDSPIGLAAYLLEKFQGWSEARGTEKPPPMDRDALLTNVMMYWLSDAGASTWMYRYLIDRTGFTLPPGRRIETPTGICSFPHDIAEVAPAQLARRSYNLTHRTVAPHGGHFPGLDARDFLTRNIQGFFAAHR